MPEIYVSTDVETDGPIPGPHSMLSFASAAYRADKTLVGTFAANLTPLPGAAGDPKTMDWWRGQPEAWEVCRSNPRDPEGVMPEYVAWLKSLPGKPVFVAYRARPRRCRLPSDRHARGPGRGARRRARFAPADHAAAHDPHEPPPYAAEDHQAREAHALAEDLDQLAGLARERDLRPVPCPRLQRVVRPQRRHRQQALPPGPRRALRTRCGRGVSVPVSVRSGRRQ